MWQRHRTTLGGTTHRKKYTGEGGHHTYFLDWVNNWGEEGGGHHTFFVQDGAQCGNIQVRKLAGYAGYVVQVVQAMWSGLHRLCGGVLYIIQPLCGSILQAGTCQILSLAENPK